MAKPRVLFVCRTRQDAYGITFGLMNSAKFVAEALSRAGLETKVVSVVDNNAIDKQVYLYKPTHVMIEALWVTPEKLLVLMKLHPKVDWTVRVHSKTPFLAMEGIALTWLAKYREMARHSKRFHVAPNNIELHEDLDLALRFPNVYLPNVYVCKDVESDDDGGTDEYGGSERCGCGNDDGDYDHHHNHHHNHHGHHPHHPHHDDEHHHDHDNDPPSAWDVPDYDCSPTRGLRDDVNIGCFGAIRPLKNHLLQAMAAIRFADSINKRLNFYINSNRIEQRGNNVLKNVRALFDATNHTLVEIPWVPHREFLELVSRMDIGMQVSLSESFNIVTADFVCSNVPIVVSEDVDWMPLLYRANANSVHSILKTMRFAWKMKGAGFHKVARKALMKHNKDALHRWAHFLSHTSNMS